MAVAVGWVRAGQEDTRSHPVRLIAARISASPQTRSGGPPSCGVHWGRCASVDGRSARRLGQSGPREHAFTRGAADCTPTRGESAHIAAAHRVVVSIGFNAHRSDAGRNAVGRRSSARGQRLFPPETWLASQRLFTWSALPTLVCTRPATLRRPDLTPVTLLGRSSRACLEFVPSDRIPFPAESLSPCLFAYLPAFVLLALRSYRA